jgi:hypothetical protein
MGFGVCRVSRRTRHTMQGTPKGSSRGAICLQHTSALKMFSARLQASGFRKLSTIRYQTKCTHFWNFSISSPSNGAHFLISHPHNAEDYNTPSEGACGCSLAYILRPVKFKYEWSYTTTSPCAFKACTATNLTDFSYEMFMQICWFIQTYSRELAKRLITC